MKFLQQLSPHIEIHDVAQKEQIDESSVIRTIDQLGKYTARDIADFAFLHFLILHLLQNDFESALVVKGHATRTLQMGGHFKRFTLIGTDLYMYLHVLLGGTRDRLKKNPANELFWRQLVLSEREIKDSLQNMSNGRRLDSTQFRFLQKLEKDLRVDNSNYRSCRRLISDWNDITTNDQRLVVTRLLMALRSRCPQSDLLVPLQDYARRKHMELKSAKNPEIQNESK